MKFKKNKNVNTIEYFAICACAVVSCNCVCTCSCTGSEHALQNIYDKEYHTRYDGIYDNNVPSVDRSYM